MFKIKREEGFTIVELMIVVAIIGILAAVAIPFYSRYIQKSRLGTYVFPGMHVIETNIATYYSAKATYPSSIAVSQVLIIDADTTYFHPQWDEVNELLVITLKQIPNGPFKDLAKPPDNWFTSTPHTNPAKGIISRWSLGGPIAEEFGLDE
jgi:type IV pilus assembly protein PilA